MFTDAWRKQLWEVDARWHTKFAFRIIMNAFCILSILCAIFTLRHSESKFTPKAFQQAKTVIVYLPCDGITIVWNILNIVFFMTRRKPFLPIVNVLVHFLVGVGFAIVGIFVTIVCWTGYRALDQDIYNVAAAGEHTVTDSMGHPVDVNSQNISDCPAFSSCEAQKQWLENAHRRALVSVIGCGFFDAVFLLHALLFFWCTNDSIFGLRGRSQRKEAKETRRKRQEDEKNILITETSDPNKEVTIPPKHGVTIKEYERHQGEYPSRLGQHAVDKKSQPYTSASDETSHTSMTYGFKENRSQGQMSESPNFSYPSRVSKSSSDFRESSSSITNITQELDEDHVQLSLFRSTSSVSSLQVPGQENARTVSSYPDAVRKSSGLLTTGYPHQQPHRHHSECSYQVSRTSTLSLASTRSMPTRPDFVNNLQHNGSQLSSYRGVTSAAPTRTQSPPQSRSSSPSNHSLHSVYSTHGFATSSPLPPIPSPPQSYQHDGYAKRQPVRNPHSSSPQQVTGSSQQATTTIRYELPASFPSTASDALRPVDNGVMARSASQQPARSSRPNGPRRKSTLRNEIMADRGI